MAPYEGVAESQKRMGEELVAIDLCGGAGGWACAARGLPVRIWLAIDWDPAALLTYRLNHPDVQPVVADLRRMVLGGSTLKGRVDVVLGGIPCETISKYRDLSQHSKPKPEEVADWQMLLDVSLELIRAIDPPWWCLEDTPNIIKHLPPLVPYEYIDAADFSGQRRRRAYVGAFPRPAPKNDWRRLRSYLRPGPYRIGPRVWHREPKRIHNWSAQYHQWWDPERKSPTICTISSKRDPESVVVDEALRRQLEWQEAATAQGFPDDYVFYGSPSTVAKHIGQAIQIDTGRAILKAIVGEARTRGVLCRAE